MKQNLDQSEQEFDCLDYFFISLLEEQPHILKRSQTNNSKIMKFEQHIQQRLHDGTQPNESQSE